MGSFAGVRLAIRIRILRIGSAFKDRIGFLDLVRLLGKGSVHLFLPFSDGLRHRRLCCRRRRRLHFNLPLSCAKFELIYHTSLDSL